MITGRVIELWRYPVKSMLGERMESTSLTPDGFEGDRRYALRSVESGRILSAKKVSRLLQARSQLGTAVTVTLPDGSQLSVDDPAVDERLSAWLGRAVKLERVSGGTERPEMEGDTRVYRGRAGSFFDSSPIHVVTTSTLRRLTEWYPNGLFDARRFRPNIVLATPDDGFVEEGWVGAALRVGDVSIEITKPCARCVMTTHAQEELPVDRDILRTVNARNDEHVGVYGTVRAPGKVAVGDEATIIA